MGRALALAIGVGLLLTPSAAGWDFDLTHVRLDLDADPAARRLGGTATLSLTARKDASVLPLKAAKALRISAVTVDGKAASFVHEAPRLRVTLAARRGQALTVAIAYRVQPSGRGVYFVGPDTHNPGRLPQLYTQSEPDEGHHWWPGHHEPSEKSTSEMRVRVPKAFVAVSNGSLVSNGPADAGRVLFHWKQKTPHSGYLIALMVGRFRKLEIGSHRGIPLTVYAQAADAARAKRSTAQTAAMMAHFEELIGTRYPFSKYAQVMVGDYKWAGMEHSSATTLTERTMHDARAALDVSSEPLVAHELAHQWYGDAITCAHYGELWLNEGFATYFEQVWATRRWGESRARWGMHDSGLGALGADDREAKPVVRPRKTAPRTMFDARSYNKGGRVLHMLRMQLGEDAFWRALRLYTARHWLGSVTTRQLRAACEEAAKADLSRFFRQWLHEPGYPRLRVRERWIPGDRGGQLELTIEQTQQARKWPLFVTPLDIAYEVGGKRIAQRLQLLQPKHVFRWPLAAEPAYIRINDGGWLLCRVDFPQPLKRLLVQLARDPDVLGRRAALERLTKAQWQRLDVQLALARVLRSDRSRNVRRLAADRLGRAGGTLAAAALLDGVGDADAKVRAMVADGLGVADDPQTEAALRTLTKDRSYWVAGMALRSLVGRGVEDRDRLIDAFLEQRGHDDLPRKFALQACGDAGETEHLVRLRTATLTGSFASRREAIHQLPRLKGRHKEGVTEALVGLLADPSPKIRREAIGALVRLGDRALKGPLSRVAKHDRDAGVKEHAKRAIKAIDEKHKPLPLPLRIADLEKQVAALRRRLGAEQDAAGKTQKRLAQLEMQLKLLQFKADMAAKRRAREGAGSGSGSGSGSGR